MTALDYIQDRITSVFNGISDSAYQYRLDELDKESQLNNRAKENRTLEKRRFDSAKTQVILNMKKLDKARILAEEDVKKAEQKGQSDDRKIQDQATNEINIAQQEVDRLRKLRDESNDVITTARSSGIFYDDTSKLDEENLKYEKLTDKEIIDPETNKLIPNPNLSSYLTQVNEPIKITTEIKAPDNSMLNPLSTVDKPQENLEAGKSPLVDTPEKQISQNKGTQSGYKGGPLPYQIFEKQGLNWNKDAGRIAQEAIAAGITGLDGYKAGAGTNAQNWILAKYVQDKKTPVSETTPGTEGVKKEPLQFEVPQSNEDIPAHLPDEDKQRISLLKGEERQKAIDEIIIPEALAQAKQNPQFMNQLIGSNIDVNDKVALDTAVLKLEKGYSEGKLGEDIVGKIRERQGATGVWDVTKRADQLQKENVAEGKKKVELGGGREEFLRGLVDKNDTTYTNIDKNERAYMDQYKKEKSDTVSHTQFNEILKRAHEGNKDARGEMKQFLATTKQNSPELYRQYSEFYKNKTAPTSGIKPKVEEVKITTPVVTDKTIQKGPLNNTPDVTTDINKSNNPTVISEEAPTVKGTKKNPIVP